MKSYSNHLPAPKAPVAMGSLVVEEMAWNEAVEVQVSPNPQEVISGSVRTKVIALENHSIPNNSCSLNYPHAAL